MLELTESWMFYLVSIFTALIVVLIAWVQYCQGYWSRRGVYCPPKKFFFGNGYGVFTQQSSFGDFSEDMYNDIKKNSNLHGGTYLLCSASYMPIDPELIKNIMQADFNHFVDRGIYFNEHTDPLSAHLFSLEGTPWRLLRQKLTPTFTSLKMKMMFETLVKCSDQLTIEMDKTVGIEPINIKDILVCFTTDIIGNCAFGIDCNSLKNPETEFNQYAKLFLISDFRQNIKAFFLFIAPNLMRAIGATMINQQLATFFMRVVKDTVEYREKNKIYRKDFMHLMLQLKNRGELVDDDNIFIESDESVAIDDKLVKLSLNQLAAQAFFFFLAGFETSSTAMTFCLFELASNQDVQEKLRTEVKEVLSRHDNQLSYDAIMEMHYMERVINETLRKYPPVPLLNRICTKEYKVPGSDLVIEKGTKVLIPVLGLQRDEKYYPDSEKFDPERFTKENKRKRHPYTYLPFGKGPRNCIGLRFGMMQTKVGISGLLKNYRFSINKKTQVPLQLDPRSFVMAPEGGIWLDYSKV